MDDRLSYMPMKITFTVEPEMVSKMQVYHTSHNAICFAIAHSLYDGVDPDEIVFAKFSEDMIYITRGREVFECCWIDYPELDKLIDEIAENKKIDAPITIEIDVVLNKYMTGQYQSLF